jgi:hypothetical protein
VRYRVVNTATEELIADFATGQFELAKQFANELAESSNHRDRYSVLQIAVVYKTAPKERQENQEED